MKIKMYNPDKIDIQGPSLEDNIEELLKQSEGVLPEELIAKLQTDFDDAEDNEALRKVQERIIKAIEFRNKPKVFKNIDEELFCKSCSPEMKNHIGKLIDQVIVLAQSGELPFLGEGRTGKVYLNKENSPYCIKLILGDKNIYEKENNVKVELSFLLELQDLEIDGVRVPQGYYYRGTNDMHLYVMEALDAVTLEDVLNNKETLPDSFDFKEFFENLENFIRVMNEKYKIFHRDLHGGNIMIDRKTGKGYVIDFGSATKHVGNSEEAFQRRGSDGSTVRYTSDLENLRKQQNKIQEFIGEKNAEK